MTRPRLNAIAIGGAHQFRHFLPAVFELQGRGNVDTKIFIPDDGSWDLVQQLAADLRYPAPNVVIMTLPRPLRTIFPQHRRKMPTIAYWRRELRDCDALLCAERTSTILKRLPGRCPMMIHIPHGAGDRAAGFEKRIALFDHVLVSGAKDQERLVSALKIGPERCPVVGSVKLAASMRIAASRPCLFNNDRPTILFNPHFSRTMGTFFAIADRLIEQVLADGRYNLIIAPHVRLASGWSKAKRDGWEARSIPDRLLIDMGSARSWDMTYNLAAHCYLGDVSSQIYEFVATPRPCLFVDRNATRWEDDRNYAMWRFGPVIDSGVDFVEAIDQAIATHALYRPEQLRALADAFFGFPFAREQQSNGDAIMRAADAIDTILRAPRAINSTGR